MDFKPRTKGVPMDFQSVAKVATSKPVLWGIGAIVVLGAGYWLMSANSSQASTAGTSATDLTGSYSVPISYQSNGQVATTTDTSGTDYTQALVALETQQAGYNYSATIAGLNSQTVLGLVGNQTSQMAIQSANYQTSSQILANAQNLFKSGFNAITGTISAPGGGTTSINLAASMSGGKGSANQILNNFVSSNAYSAFTPTQTATATPAQTGATTATNQLVSASLATLVQNGGLGVAA